MGGKSRQQDAANKELGKVGEEFAARFYVRRGYHILDRNWRRREGELDLVVRGKGVTAFCEVKTRRANSLGAPFEAVGAAKQARLRTLAWLWLEDHPGSGGEIRFDVASITVDGGRARLEVIEDAFEKLDLAEMGYKGAMKMRGNRGVRALVLILTGLAIYQQLRRPSRERTWQGKILGFVPYDFRFPSPERIRERMFNPKRGLLSPQVFGVGWTVNLARLRRFLP